MPLSSVENKHMLLIDQMISWQVANPGQPYTKMAAALGLSTLWCRRVASTDAYKVRAAEQSDVVFREIGIMGLKERITEAANAAVERMAQKIEFAESLPEITDAAEVLFDAHYKLAGVGGGDGPRTVNVQTNVILQGRDAMLSGAGAATTTLLVEGGTGAKTE
jgi:hypothetical protein